MNEWKETEVGTIPQKWNLEKAENYCIRVTDGTHATPKPTNDGKYLITSKHIIGGRIDLAGAYKISVNDFNEINKRSKVEQWDILYSMIGTVGEAALVSDKKVEFAIKNVGLFKCGDELRARWLKYYLDSPLGLFHLKSRLSGTTQKYITLGELRNFPIPYPEDLNEWKQIISILVGFDQKIDFLRQQNETLEQIAQTLFKRWFVEFEFPYDFARGTPDPSGSPREINELAKGDVSHNSVISWGKPYKSSGGKMTPSELGEIPQGWRVTKIGDEVRILGGGTPSTTQPEYWQNGVINWYTPSDLTSNSDLFSLGSARKISKKGLSESSATLFPKHSLLMTSRATIGEIAINMEEACTNQGFIILVPTNDYSIYFLHNWLITQLQFVQQLASGSTFPEISRRVFKQFDILKIPKIITYLFADIVKPLYEKIENNIRESKTLIDSRDLLLPKLMSGQIRVGQENRTESNDND